MAVIPSIIGGHAARMPEHPALVVADGEELSYRALADSMASLAQALRDCGLTSTDTVGIALRDGYELVLAFLAATNVCGAAPLNPTYHSGEFVFEIEDLQLSAMIVGVDDAEVVAAVDAARHQAIPVLRVSSRQGEPWSTVIEADSTRERPKSTAQLQQAAPDDVALVLHTSGTTSRPKIVPLTHANVAASALAIGRTLELAPADRGCCVMPLFHIHGLMAGLCAPLVAGATVITTPGFNAPSMARWLRTHEASWYTAVPTMHQSILERKRIAGDEFEGVDLRFIRSSSASLAPNVMEELEAEFDCPVIESYGMTEAAHQMSSNPLPPAPRKPGSVGIPAGPEVAVMGADGRLLGAGSVGEVVIKGPNVMQAYRGDGGATRAAFEAGWFRTGDQGRFDGDGYLYLTGRIKEIINRGGENVSPREVDELLLQHPMVSQAVTFSVPDTRLGEQVAAAVVLAATDSVHDPAVTERTLRQFAAERLAPYKVPRRVIVMDSIPTGPSGKLRRIGLAEELGLENLDQVENEHGHQEPSTAAQELLAELWMEVLGRNGFGVWDHFLDVGGDSLTATQLLTRLRDEVDVEISMLDFFDLPTIAQQSELLEEMLLAEADSISEAEDPPR